MLLGQIRDYVKTRGSVSLQDVMLHFDIAADTAEFALNYWLRKGKIHLQTASCSSGGCSSTRCSSSQSAQYNWAQRAMPLHFYPRQS